jgi:hypothetical protein
MQNYGHVANENPEFVDNRAVRISQHVNYDPNPEFVDNAAHRLQHLNFLPGVKNCATTVLQQANNETNILAVGYELIAQRNQTSQSVAHIDTLGLRRSRPIARSFSLSFSHFIQPRKLLTARTSSQDATE